MAKQATTTELRKMSVKDLGDEIREAKVVIAKLRLGVKLQKEKDTAKYVREKKQLARMETILSEKQPRQPKKPRIAESSSTPENNEN